MVPVYKNAKLLGSIVVSICIVRMYVSDRCTVLSLRLFILQYPVAHNFDCIVLDINITTVTHSDLCCRFKTGWWVKYDKHIRRKISSRFSYNSEAKASELLGISVDVFLGSCNSK